MSDVVDISTVFGVESTQHFTCGFAADVVSSCSHTVAYCVFALVQVSYGLILDLQNFLSLWRMHRKIPDKSFAFGGNHTESFLIVEARELESSGLAVVL